MNHSAVADTKTVVVACNAMATRFELVLCGDTEAALYDAGEAAIEDIRDAHHRLSRFESSSVVSAINVAAGQGPVRVDDEIFDLLALCESIRVASHDAFDVTLGRSRLKLDARNRTVMIAEAGATIDLGGIGKGHAIDLATATLQDSGIEHALLHGGTSTVTAIGARPDGNPWTVRVAEGFNVTLRDESLSISNAVEGSASRRKHIVGCSDVDLAAARHTSAAVADAWSTAVIAGTPVIPIRHAYQAKDHWTLSEDWNQ